MYLYFLLVILQNFWALKLLEFFFLFLFFLLALFFDDRGSLVDSLFRIWLLLLLSLLGLLDLQGLLSFLCWFLWRIHRISHFLLTVGRVNHLPKSA